MFNIFLRFLKKTYKILIALLAVIVFFWVYNRYLVDRSLLNLRFVLAKIEDVKNIEEAQKLAKVLEALLAKEMAPGGITPAVIAGLQLPKETEQAKGTQQLAAALQYTILNEVGKEKLDQSGVAMLEMVKDILLKPQNIAQLEDAKFALKEMIGKKESKRSGVLVALDKVTQAFAPQKMGVPKEQLEKQVDALRQKIRAAREKDALQGAYYELANVYTQLGEITKAKDAYQKVIDLQPDTGLAEKSQFNLAWNAKLQGNLNEAIQAFQAIAKDQDLGVFSQYQIADILRKQGKYEQAIGVLEQVAVDQPQTDLAQLSTYLTGQTYLYDLDQGEKAKEKFEQTQGLFQGTDIAKHVQKQALASLVGQYRNKGFKLLQQGYTMSLSEKYSEALTNFDQALEYDLNDALSYTGKALAFLWLKDENKALEFAKKAVKLLPDDEVISVNLGYIYIQLKLIDDAILEYRRLITFNRGASRAYYNLGYAYILKNRLEEAVLSFQEAAKLDQLFIQALNNQGWCLWQLGRYAEAIEVFEQAVRINPRYLDALFNLGLIYKTTGKYKEAKMRFEEIWKINSGYPHLQQYLNEVERILRISEGG